MEILFLLLLASYNLCCGVSSIRSFMPFSCQYFWEIAPFEICVGQIGLPRTLICLSQPTFHYPCTGTSSRVLHFIPSSPEVAKTLKRSPNFFNVAVIARYLAG